MALRDLIVSIDFDDIDIDNLIRVDTALDDVEDQLRGIGRELSDTALDFARMGSVGENALSDVRTDALLTDRALQQVENEIEDIIQDELIATATTGAMGNAFAIAGIKGIAMGVGITGVLAVLLAMLGPIVVLMGGLVASILAAGLGIAAFGAVAIPVMTDFFEASTQVADLEEKIANATTAKERIAAQKELNALYADMSDSQRGALKELQNFKDFFGEFTSQFESPIFDAFNTTLQLTRNILTGLGPTISSVAGVVNLLLTEMNTSVSGGGLQGFFSWLESNGADAIYNLAHIVGNTLSGIFKMFAAFSPIGAEIEGGLLSMTQRFSEWAGNLGASNGFQKFIEYAQTNGPVLMSFLGGLFSVIGDVIKGLAPLGTVALAGLDALFGFISTNLSPVFAQFGGFVVQLASFFISTLLPAILPLAQQYLPILGQAFGNLMNLGQALFDAFVAIFPTLQSIFMSVMPVAISLFQGLQGIIGSLINGVVIPLLPKIATILSEVWSVVKPILDPLKNLLSAVGTTIMALINNVVSPLIPIISAIISAMWKIVKPILEAIVSTFNAIVTAITNAVEWVGKLVSAFKNFKMPEWVSSIGDKVGGAFNKVKGWVDGSHATGLARVPYNGYVAELHADESVLTAAQSNMLRSAGILSDDGSGKPKVNIDNKGGSPDPGSGGIGGGGGNTTFAPSIIIQIDGSNHDQQTIARLAAEAAEEAIAKFWRQMNMQQA